MENWKNGEMLKNATMINRFNAYFNTNITSTSNFKTLLEQNNNWFNDIFVNTGL